MKNSCFFLQTPTSWGFIGLYFLSLGEKCVEYIREHYLYSSGLLEDRYSQIWRDRDKTRRRAARF